MQTGYRGMAVAAVLALTALGFVGYVAARSGPPAYRPQYFESAVEPATGWVASEREGGFAVISYPLSGISARRIITDPGINSPLALAQNGREVLVTGHFGCEKGQDYEIQTSVTQSSTGALSRGRIQGRCSGQKEQFEAGTWVYDRALFEPGAGQACALLMTRAQNKITDVFQWCRKEDVILAAKGPSS